MRMVARYTGREILRSWLFWLFVLFLAVFVIGSQLLLQSNLFLWSATGAYSLASFIPFLNSILYALTVVFPLFFVAASLYRKGKRIDTHEVMLVRPESNGEYLAGVAWGGARVFVLLAVFLQAIASMIHLFASSTPFNGGLYLFYLLAGTVPTVVFLTGFSMSVVYAVANPGLRLLVLFLTGGCFLLFSGELFEGWADPWGREFPATFSEITGYPRVGLFLLHRLGWFLTGCSLLFFSMLLIRRLPNTPGERKRYASVGGGALLVALLVGGSGWMITNGDKNIREKYRATYRASREKPHAILLTHDISYTPRGSGMRSVSRFTLQNPQAQEMKEIILYLNPGLKVNRFSIGGKDHPFHRENQLLHAVYTLRSQEIVEVEMEYEGRIDDRICYTEISDRQIKERRKSHLLSYFEDDYAIQERHYTLLTPECLWYPVSTLPADPDNSYGAVRDFTRYGLEVRNARGKTVISQGERTETKTSVSFRNEVSLVGISLCIGNYRRTELTVDSVRYELCLLKGHEHLLPSSSVIKDTLPGVVRKMRAEIEAKLKREYPYRRLTIVESPVSFSSYYRGERGGSEYVQPELFFLPERGFSLSLPDFTKTPRRIGLGDIHAFNLFPMPSLSEITPLFLGVKGIESVLGKWEQDDRYKGGYGLGLGKFFASEHSPATPVQREYSPYAIYPWFYQSAGFFFAEGYPLIDRAVHTLLWRGTRIGATGVGLRGVAADQPTQKALAALSQKSLDEIMQDKTLSIETLQRVVDFKADELLDRLALFGMSQEQILDAILSRWYRYPFSRQNLTDIGEELGIRRCDMEEMLHAWNHGTEIAVFRFTDLAIDRVISGTRNKEDKLYRISLGVYNDSDTPGFLAITTQEVWKRMTVGINIPVTSTQEYAIPPRQGKEIVYLYAEEPSMVTVNTKISRNIPSEHTFSTNTNLIPRGETTDTLQGLFDRDHNYFFRQDTNVYIVDNEDPGFRIVNSPVTHLLRRLFEDKKDPSDDLYSGYSEIKRICAQWSCFVDPKAYGDVRKTVVAKTSGKGESLVEWEVELDRPGEYEVFVSTTQMASMYGTKYYMTRTVSPYSLRRKESDFGGTRPVFSHYYTVYYGEKSHEVVWDAYSREAGNWISLGSYPFPAGKHKVVLSDRGEDEKNPSVIHADAVKWVFK